MMRKLQLVKRDSLTIRYAAVFVQKSQQREDEFLIAGGIMPKKQDSRNKQKRPSKLVEMERAGLTAGLAAFKQWATIATAYAEEVGSILIESTQGKRDQKEDKEAAVEILRKSKNYLSQISTLPRVSGLRFYSELERARKKTSSAPR
jgi:hypothetical protein